jgi:tRNA (guanine10-N2)-methyltransferase
LDDVAGNIYQALDGGTKANPWSHIVERIGMLKTSVNFKGRARMKGAEHLFWSMETADLSDQG